MQLKTLPFLTFLALGVFHQAALAAIPPLSEDDRRELASDIVTGYVIGLQKKDIDLGYATQSLYTAQLIVSEIEKGNNVIPHQTLRVDYWKKSFKDGRCGDGGQMGSMKHYRMVRAFLKYDDWSNRFDLLSPNGFDTVSGFGLH